MIRIIAILTLWLALLPSAFFVGRSVYWHLIHQWHMDLGVLGIGAAVVSGAMIELVGILSAHVALATARWNNRGDVQWSKREIKERGERKRGGKERSPVGLAAGCFAAYVIAAFLLAVVLEAVPSFAVWAPALFTVMAAAAYIGVGVYEQHRDRLHYYRLEWDWKSVPDTVRNDQETVPNVPDTVSNVSGSVRDTSRTAVKLDNLDRAILRTYRNDPGVSYQTLAEMVETALERSVGKSKVFRRVRNKLEPAGLIERTGDEWAVHWSDNGGGKS